MLTVTNPRMQTATTHESDPTSGQEGQPPNPEDITQVIGVTHPIKQPPVYSCPMFMGCFLKRLALPLRAGVQAPPPDQEDDAKEFPGTQRD